VFGALKVLGEARVSEAHEREGLDLSEHGVETYPEFSVGDEPAVTDGGTTYTDRRASSGPVPNPGGDDE
jgi:Amt family ammonium transporter